MNEISTISSKLAIIKTLSNAVRLEALFRLFIDQRLSLSDLSKFLKKSKNTVIYHMKFLITVGLVKEYDEKVEGSIKPAKFYELNPAFYKIVFLNFEELANLSSEENLDSSRNIFQWNILLFETIREFLRYLGTFYEVGEKQIDTPSQTSKFLQQYHVPRDLIPLSEKGYQTYLHIYHTFMQQVMQILEHDTQNSKDSIITRPYLAMNMVIPIQKLVEFGDKGEIKKMEL